MCVCVRERVCVGVCAQVKVSGLYVRMCALAYVRVPARQPSLSIDAIRCRETVGCEL